PTHVPPLPTPRSSDLGSVLTLGGTNELQGPGNLNVNALPQATPTTSFSDDQSRDQGTVFITGDNIVATANTVPFSGATTVNTGLDRKSTRLNSSHSQI